MPINMNEEMKRLGLKAESFAKKKKGSKTPNLKVCLESLAQFQKMYGRMPCPNPKDEKERIDKKGYSYWGMYRKIQRKLENAAKRETSESEGED